MKGQVAADIRAIFNAQDRVDADALLSRTVRKYAQTAPKLAVLGGVFAWMAETRQSLVPSILGHFLQNSMATAMILLALGG